MQFKYSTAFILALSAAAPSFAEETGSTPSFFSDARWSLLTRSVYEQRDYLHGDKSNGGRNATLSKSLRSDYAEEWGLGLIGTLESGYTPGVIGFGLDAIGALAQNLDGDDYRVGKIRLLPVDQNGYAQSSIARGGVALKARVSNTVLRYGEQRVKTPLFSASDTRLLPESMNGLFVTSTDIETLTLQAGHMTGSTDRNATTSDNALTVNYLNPKTARGSAFDLIGGTWNALPQLSLRAFSGRLENTWQTQYVGFTYTHALGKDSSLGVDSHLYSSRDTGESLAGKIRNTTGSLMGTYATGPQKFGLGWQKVAGDTPFDYVTRGAIWLNNAAQLSDFNAPHEQSWQVRYDLDASAFTLPGLSFGAAYIHGKGTDGTRMASTSGYAWLGYGAGGKHWERDLWLKYTVASGKAKGTSVLFRYGAHRGNAAQAELNTDQIRVSVEFPMGG